MRLCAFVPSIFCHDFSFGPGPVLIVEAFLTSTLLKKLISADADLLFDPLVHRLETPAFAISTSAGLSDRGDRRFRLCCSLFGRRGFARFIRGFCCHAMSCSLSSGNVDTNESDVGFDYKESAAACGPIRTK